MIELRDVYKSYPTRSGANQVLRGVDFAIRPGEKVGIIGRNGAGKSTLIRIISGSELPTRGEVRHGMSVSWPLAFSGAFQGSLTGYDNLRFICRIYGVDEAGKVPFVQEFSELGHYLREPVKSYSSGMRARLAFAISMVVDFDCYLIDEVVSVGDAVFQEKCLVELFEKRATRAKIIISHDDHYIRKHCDRVLLLSDGKLHAFDEVSEAFERYREVTHA